MKKVRLGTRGSALALEQSRMVEEVLAPFVETERVVIKTSGDRRTDVPLHAFSREVGDKGAFTKELEEALLADEVDLAVHSLKDVPTQLDGRFRIGAVLPRAPVCDVLVTKDERGLASLPEGARVATGSVRRRCLLQDIRPDLKVEEIRGNVPTRLGKLAGDGGCEGLILAEAGLARLGLLEVGGRVEGFPRLLWERLEPAAGFLPAACQGIVGIELLGAREDLQACLARLNDAEAWEEAVMEREFLRLLGGGCETPVGVWTRRKGEELLLDAVVYLSGDGGAKKSAKARGAVGTGLQIARKAYGNLR